MQWKDPNKLPTKTITNNKENTVIVQDIIIEANQVFFQIEDAKVHV